MVLKHVLAKPTTYAYNAFLMQKNIDSLIDWPFQQIDTK
jgi:hypothetical protein